MPLLAALLMLFLIWANYSLHRDVMYPGFLQASLWFVTVSLFLLNQGTFVPVSDSVFILLLAGVVLFSMGAFVGSYDHRPHLTRNYLLEGTLPSKRTVAILASVVAFGLVMYVSRARDLSLSGPSTNPFFNLRYAVSENSEETGGFGVVSYFGPLGYVLAAITILMRLGSTQPHASRTLVGAAVSVGVVFGVLSSGRSVLLPLVVIVLAIPAVLRAAGPVKIGVTLAFITLLLFAGVGVALGKGGNIGSSFSENWSAARESFVAYSVGGIPALSVYLDNQAPVVELGLNSMRTLFAVAQALGFQATVVPLVQPVVDVPMPMNVYTVYQPYIKDFGPLGGISVLFVLGFLHAVLYRRATVRKPHAIYVFLFAVSLFPLAMQVFQDSYFSLLSTWLQYGAYAVLLFVLHTRRGNLLWSMGS